MKFKYYLKGLGMGIIVTTIIMTVSCVVHNNNLSDQEIIEKAKKLGMVMAESQTESEDNLFGNNKESSDSGDDSEMESDSETQSETETELESQTQKTEDSQLKEPETQETESQDTIYIEITQYILHVNTGDTPRMIATELYENGMIDSASAFRKYLGDNGYAGKLRTGTYTITKGMSYEEIAQMITKM